MAVITRIQGSGSGLNTPWTEVVPATPGTAEMAVSYGAGYRTTDDVYYKLESSPSTFTLSDGVTVLPIMYLFSCNVVSGSAYDFNIAVVAENFDEDEMAQDMAAATSLSVVVGGATYSVSESDTGISFNSSVGTVSIFDPLFPGTPIMTDYIFLRFRDTRTEFSNVLLALHNDVRVT